jgi:hypothetical protein
MDAIEILLEGLQQGAAQSARMLDGSGIYVLTAEDDIVVNLHEDVTTNRVSFFTSPGYLQRRDWSGEKPVVWTMETCRHPDDPEAGRMLRIDSDTGLVLLVHSTFRERLDTVRFRIEFEQVVYDCRQWKSLLAVASEKEVVTEAGK